MPHMLAIILHRGRRAPIGRGRCARGHHHHHARTSQGWGQRPHSEPHVRQRGRDGATGTPGGEHEEGGGRRGRRGGEDQHGGETGGSAGGAWRIPPAGLPQGGPSGHARTIGHDARPSTHRTRAPSHDHDDPNVTKRAKTKEMSSLLSSFRSFFHSSEAFLPCSRSLRAFHAWIVYMFGYTCVYWGLMSVYLAISLKLASRACNCFAR